MSEFANHGANIRQVSWKLQALLGRHLVHLDTLAGHAVNDAIRARVHGPHCVGDSQGGEEEDQEDNQYHGECGCPVFWALERQVKRCSVLLQVKQAGTSQPCKLVTGRKITRARNCGNVHDYVAHESRTYTLTNVLMRERRCNQRRAECTCTIGESP